MSRRADTMFESKPVLFWDDLHPTTAADAILAAQFANAVPEPSTWLMVSTGVVGLAGVLRRKLTL